MMWWNVENLFDTVDDPLTRDSEFTPEGKKRWTEKKLLLKCMRISHIVKVAALKTGGYPGILAFAEVENLNVFKKLLSFLPDNSYKTAYHASNDPRGIDIALAYDAEKIRLLRTLSYRVNLRERNTRDITLYSFTADNCPFFLLVNHWPSRSLDQAWSEPFRLQAAQTAKTIIDSLRKISTDADIVVMGDFNDDPGDKSIQEILHATTERDAFSRKSIGKLFNFWTKSREKGSCYFRSRWFQFDQVMVSSGLFDDRGLSVPEDAFSCFHIRHMEKGSNRRPYATYKGPKYLGGYSDHFPLLFQAEVHKP
ncbi:MAG: endonuclease [Chlorobium phaeobacteroides]|nr:endonuclease [Chlorobium phaeobacteroides]MBL6956412.1 endonuclease [Chlorobium phaeobacteroides]